MESRRVILALLIAAVISVAALPCSAAQKDAAQKDAAQKDKDEESIWTEDEQREPRGPRQGERPRRGQGRGGPGSRRFELTEEEIDSIMDSLKKRSPEKAKELEKLREKEPEKFIGELRRHAREEFGKVVRERIEKWRQQRQAEFIEWLEKSVPKEAKELAKIKESSPDLYGKKYELAWKKYGRIFDESRRNPELADVLIEDLKLQKRREELVPKIKAAKTQKEKDKLTAELEEVVGRRYDLIVRRKQIAYERLLKWLEELQNRIKESRNEIIEWQDANAKAENIKQRTQELLEGKSGFSWD